MILQDLRIRAPLSSWKQGRGFRSVASHHYRKVLVPHASQTDLNREFANPGQTSAGLFIIVLMVLAVIDYLCLRMVLA
jgi:hypothetical protein